MLYFFNLKVTKFLKPVSGDLICFCSTFILSHPDPGGFRYQY
uniref:Uncharacterized protein n=2 Tax=Klebsiella pneumoniae TaxID=573 RepID=A0A6B9D3H9_KLEPN|nr:hypothetical protein [Klebsiella pneumoniae]QQM12489.1 hypothetical protein [Klebsiella pneumoniae subsp. pneumoniae]UYS97292.1 hypothetical protein [Proteus mirabilis]QIS36626.1 hypothetical protein [Klebsiella pneumoniae]QJX12915.1 hypothetical protein [Klebsiella pneumoniae]